MDEEQLKKMEDFVTKLSGLKNVVVDEPLSDSYYIPKQYLEFPEHGGYCKVSKYEFHSLNEKVKEALTSEEVEWENLQKEVFDSKDKKLFPIILKIREIEKKLEKLEKNE